MASLASEYAKAHAQLEARRIEFYVSRSVLGQIGSSPSEKKILFARVNDRGELAVVASPERILTASEALTFAAWLRDVFEEIP